GDVGIGRDRAAVVGLALVDLHPAPVGAPLHMAPPGGAMLNHAFRDPGLNPILGLAYLAARGGIANDGLERHALFHDIDAAGIMHVPVSPIENDQLVVGIVEREALLYGLY